MEVSDQARRRVSDPRAERELVALVDGLYAAVSDNLVSVVLYGSAARGEYARAASDLNVMLVVDPLTPETLERLSGPVKQWEHGGQPPPRLFSRTMLDASADVFPIEFLDIKAAHVVLHGEDPLANLVVHLDHLRLQCERELREKMMRLREAYLEVHDDPRGLARLLTESYSTFVALFRGCLYLHGDDVPAHHDAVVAAFAAAAGIDAGPFVEIARLKHQHAVGGDRKALFASYYHELTSAVAQVDRFAPPSGGSSS